MNEQEMAAMAGNAMATSWSPILIALSYVVAVFASYTALDLGGRVIKSSGVARKVWLFGGAAALGLGIWSMHFVGMMAMDLQMSGMTMGYSLPVTLVSLVIAFGASLVALYTVSRSTLGIKELAIAGPIMGLGIAGMHYTGMASMRMPADIQWNYALVALSVLIAIAASIVAMYLAFTFGRNESQFKFVLMGVAALVMGVAIVGMHYTGMSAATYVADKSAAMGGAHIDHSVLGFGVGFVTLLVIGLALVASTLDRRYSAQERGLEARLAARARAQQAAQRVA